MNIRAIFSSYNPTAKLLVTIGVCLVMTTVFSMIGFLVCNSLLGIPKESLADLSGTINDASLISGAKVMQTMMAVGFFIVPPFILAFLFHESTGGYLLLNGGIQKSQALFVFLLMIALLPFINALGEMNNQMQLPEGLSKLEEWMRFEEDRLAELTKSFLKMPELSSLFINLFVIALLPALGEELLFRGVLQRIFLDWSKNKHVAVWVAAFIFSAIHMQFYGFIPRFLLGALLGYLTVWSGSLYYSVLAHFFNNAAAIVMAYLFEHEFTSVDPESFGTSSADFVLVLLSMVVSVLLLRLIIRNFRKTIAPVSPYDAVN